MSWQNFFKSRISKDFLLSGFFIAALYGVTHNPITRPIPSPKPGDWSIQYMQHPLAFGLAGHNYLALRDDKGNIIYELHGLATDPTTGEWKYIGSRPTDLLKVWEFDSTHYLAEKSFPGVVLAQGTQTEMESIWQTGENCKAPINTKNIPYPPYGFSLRNETINSNSVAYTLAKCMGLDIKHIGLWTPGDTVDLLP